MLGSLFQLPYRISRMSIAGPMLRPHNTSMYARHHRVECMLGTDTIKPKAPNYTGVLPGCLQLKVIYFHAYELIVTIYYLRSRYPIIGYQQVWSAPQSLQGLSFPKSSTLNRGSLQTGWLQNWHRTSTSSGGCFCKIGRANRS